MRGLDQTGGYSNASTRYRIKICIQCKERSQEKNAKQIRIRRLAGTENKQVKIWKRAAGEGESKKNGNATLQHD